MASAMSGKALSQLLSMKSLDEAYSVRDYFRIAVKFLERHPPSHTNLPKAVACANAGSAEAIYALFLQEVNDVTVPMDAALRNWFQGLQYISENNPAHLNMTSNVLLSSMQTSLAWGVLNYEVDRSDRLKKASEYAKKALKAHDASGPVSVSNMAGMRRTLSVVAECYHEAGSAVTAEGLFQSATDKKKVSAAPLAMLELRDAFLGYARLCQKWEKRKSDEKRLKEEAASINSALPVGWKGKSGIHSSLWFWTPGEYQ